MSVWPDNNCRRKWPFTSIFALLARGVPRGYKRIYTPKSAKMDITTDAEYVANLVNVNIWLLSCNNAVYYMSIGLLYLHKDIFLADIIGYDQLKVS